jgi:hypothetical protein
MRKLKFEIDWIEPEAAKGEELAATWASLRICVNEIPVTRLSTFNGERERIFLSLYPLAEWLTLNWWYIHAEVQADRNIPLSDYQSRHNIRFAREGFALPNLIIQPLGKTRMEFRWWPERLHFQKLEFLEEGIAELNADDVTDELSKFIQAVIDKLDEAGVYETTLHTEWQNIRATEADEEDFCLTSAAMGVDPYALNEGKQQLIIDTYTRFPVNVANDFFKVANFKTLKKESDELDGTLKELEQINVPNSKLSSIKKKILHHVESNQKPWEQGYSTALLLRKELGLNGQPLGELHDIGHLLGFKELAKVIIKKSRKALPIAAACHSDLKDQPSFFLNEKNIPSFDKFAFCRSLFSYFSAPATSTNIITAARTDSQKCNRAFAAEFMAPHHSLAKKISGSTVSTEEIEELAYHYNVSTFVISHQIENHRLAEVID